MNWLLSSIAQSAAALIAIVGGLLVSRYVALHAEQQAARRRVDDLARRIAEARKELDDARSALEEYVVDDVLNQVAVYELIAGSEELPTVSEVLAAIEYGGEVDLDLLADRLSFLGGQIALAFETLLPMVPSGKFHPSWQEFRRSHGLQTGHRGAWAWTYSQITDSRAEEAREAEARARRRNDPLGLSSSYDAGLISDIARRPLVRPSTLPLVSRKQTLQAQIDASSGRVHALEQEHRLADETYEAARQPEGFRLALQVLSTFAVLGLVIPIAVMAAAPRTLSALERALIAAAFFAGVGILLRFLFVYSSFLSDSSGRESLPTSIFGLVSRESPAGERQRSDTSGGSPEER